MQWSRCMKRVALRLVIQSLVVAVMMVGVGWLSGEVQAQTCGNKLVIDKITACSWEGNLGGGSCKPVYDQDFDIPCSLSGSVCETNWNVCASSDASRCTSQNSASKCASANLAYCSRKSCWVTAGPTSPPPPATCGNGTCNSGETCSNCPADCGTCVTYTWAYITVTVYGDNGLQAPSNRTAEPSSGSNTCKGYGFASSSTGKTWNANGNCQNTWLLDMNKTDKSMNISGINSMYNGCQVKLNGTVIGSSFSGGTCSVPSRTYNQYNDKLDITLLKPTNVVPNATIKDVVNLTYGQLLPWTVEATDANGNLQSSGIYIHQGTPAIGVTTNWTRLKWVGGQNTSAMTFRHSDTSGVYI